jgi:general secretion pathway protein A
VYLNYFGLSEASFSITPDPQYLFLSEQHREALAHLLYGAGENGGFVLLTGEVGTGKTTICRAFLEQTPEQVDVALVLNPAMTAVELMHAICQEFGVAEPGHQDSVKVLVDRLNNFLLDAHARGRHPVVVIDEAQNLRPRVLEQVRLLTNLETSKQKLLQIFLIGQPELREMLASRELRQLNQRITARFHLQPLSARETADYIDHRIAVAGVQRPLFNSAALREVHRRSRGVPRLINLICDRSLLGAAVSRRLQVTPAIVRRAARELLGGEPPQASPRGQRRWAMAAALVMALGLGSWLGASGLVERARQQLDHATSVWVAISGARVDDGLAKADSDAGEQRENSDHGGVLAGSGDLGSPPAETDSVNRGVQTTAASGAANADLARPLNDSAQGAQSVDSDALAALSSEANRAGELDPAQAAATAQTAGEPSSQRASTSEGLAAIPRIALARVRPQVAEADPGELPELLLGEAELMPALVQRWGYLANSARNCAEVTRLGLECERSRERWSDLRLFDRPAALRLTVDGQQRYALVTGLDDEFAVLQQGEVQRRVPIATLDERWSGEVLMLWRLPPTGTPVIGPGSVGEPVLWLRQQLSALPDASLKDTESPIYDQNLQQLVRAFQAGRGLAVDGIAGPRTLILLNNALAETQIPRLSQSPDP